MRGLAPGVADCFPRWSTQRTPERKTLGAQAANFAAALNKTLMPWQRHTFDVALELDSDTGNFAYRNIIITVPRQSGKTTLLEVLFLLRGLKYEHQNMRYTAQTGSDARKKLVDDWLPDLTTGRYSHLLSPRLTNGHEQIMFSNGSALGLIATTKKSGHGASVDLGVLDEAFAHTDARLEQALRPAMATKPNAQLWIVSTAGTPTESPYLLQKVEQGRQHVEDGLNFGTAYFEWSAPDDADPGALSTWESCMPALGRTITYDVVKSDFLAMDLSEFQRAYLNRWVASMVEPVIPMELWAALEDVDSEALDPVAVAFDVSEDRKSGSIAIAGHRTDGKFHVEVVEHKDGTGWIAPWIAHRWHTLRPVVICCDKSGPAGSLIVDLENLNVPKQVLFDMPASDSAKACGQFYDGCVDDTPTIRHRGDFEEDLTLALDGAVKRPMADAWVWNRKSSAVDISPLVAVTLAYYGIKQHNRTPEVYSIAEIMAQKEAAAAGQSDSKTPVTPATPEVLAPDEFEELEDDD
jgi:hypothetical protein